MTEHAPDWDDLPPKVQRLFRLDIAMVVLLGVVTVVAWGFDPVARAVGWTIPEGGWLVLRLLAMVWAPWELVRFGRKVQLWSRIRGQSPLEVARTNDANWEQVQITGGPSKPPPWRPLRWFLWFWGVYQWNFRITPPTGNVRIFAYPRAMATLQPSQWVSMRRHLWIASDPDERHLVIVDPGGRWLKVCRRARWVEAHPDKVLWWLSEGIRRPSFLGLGRRRRKD